MKTIVMVILSAAAASLSAAVERHPLVDTVDGRTYAHTLIYPVGAHALPGLLMVPNWMGPTDASLIRAEAIASLGHAVLVADVYGVDVRPTTPAEAAAVAGALRAGDRAELRRRTARALAVLRAQAGEHPVDPQRLAAIGFCFGGGAVLELARSGAAVRAVVSFHGNLDTTVPAPVGTLTAHVLVLHGADDPSVPPEQVLAFMAEMRAARADWILTAYGGAVHAFTDPAAATPGRAQYHPVASARAFTAMQVFLTEVLVSVPGG